MREVADGVFLAGAADGGWCRSNAVAIRTPVGVLLVDTLATESEARRLHRDVLTLDPTGPLAVVNTHWHTDHVGGNALFDPDRIIAHSDSRDHLQRYAFAARVHWPTVDWGTLDVTVPGRSLGADIEGLTSSGVRLLSGGTGHTSGDLAAWLPSHRVLIAGDLVMPGCHPFLLSGSLAGSREWLRQLTALRPETVIGGHGGPAGADAITASLDYLDHLEQSARTAIADRSDPLTAWRRHCQGHGTWQEWSEPERWAVNLAVAITELDGRPRVHSAEAMAAMAEFSAVGARTG